MKLRNVVGFAVMATVLSGCFATKGDLDVLPVHSSFVVNEKFEDLYYRLTTPNTDKFWCDGILSSTIYQDRGEFRIYYGLVHPSLAGNNTATHNAVYAKRLQDGKTAIDLKDSAVTLAHNKITRELTNYIKTGRCE